MAKQMRLDKLLGNLGYGTRRDIKVLVRRGAATVNGQPVTDPGTQVDPGYDRITWNGEIVRYREHLYIMLHKPAGVISATEDARERTVLDLLNKEAAARSLFPVGRLDKDTEGMLLMTNDGKLAHKLLSPRKHVPKTYRALVIGSVGTTEIEAFRSGVGLDDGYVTMPAELRVLAMTSTAEARHHPEISQPYGRIAHDRMRLIDPGSTFCWIELTIQEGKFHQVKRMFAALNRKVVYLRRISMGPLALDPALSPGEWRELTQAEIDSLHSYRT